MIIKLNTTISASQHHQLIEAIAEKGFKANEIKTQSARYLVCIGKAEIDLRSFGHMPGISDIFHVSDEYKLV